MGQILGFDEDTLDRARLSRDARFDGKFFIAVKSTGIYCRPICPVRSPKKANVRYYATAAAAAEAGYRPCLRCRPEAAPGTPAWLGTSAVVRRALRLIQDGALNECSVKEFAARMGVGDRHLHRLFTHHVGASPIAVAQTARLHFAKRLLDETDLSVTQIALAAGFGSIRRFNDAFHRTYQRSPRELRKRRMAGLAQDAADEIVLKLAFRPPFDWAYMRDSLAAYAIPGVERVDSRGYARTVALNAAPVIVAVCNLESENSLELRVRGVSPADLLPLSSRARRMFDLTADPEVIARALGSDPLLASLVRARPGLRIPGSWDPFECSVHALLCQQVSLETARTLVGRIVEHAGRPIASGLEGMSHLFPSPQDVATAKLEELAISGANADAVRALSRAVADGTVDFSASSEKVVTALVRLPGVSTRAAQHVALRALAEPDAFPVWKAPAELAPGTSRALSMRELEARAEQWRPWRSYALLHLQAATSCASTSSAATRFASPRVGRPIRKAPRAAP
jgi:AraC family transcriptional regulator, regulatory protein of adaptative response / DNA-3-methyladenine glycosylase II